MTKEDQAFLHDMMNKLSKIDGYLGILKSDIGEDNEFARKIEKATNEALTLLKSYRSRLEGEQKK